MPISKANGAVATKPAETSVAQTAPAPVSRKLDTGLPTNGRDDRKTGYDDTKSRRILVQGLTQAVTQSMSLAGLGHVTEDAIVASIKNVTRQLVAFVESES